MLNTNTNKTSQPKGLYLLFFTEMWERFGFYTLQTIIILYMTKGLMMHDAQANLLYAASSSLLYLTPMIGGYLADRYLGFQRAVIIGGILFILAYLVCALPQKTFFFLGLAILTCANGFLKPNVSAMVGELYDNNDPRRDGGFTLFYMGINIGALIPPIIAGTLVTKYGWHSGFLTAALGMFIGQVIFMYGRKSLGTAGLYPRHTNQPYPLSFKFCAFLSAGVLACIALCEVAFAYPAATDYLVEVASVFVVIITSFYLMKEPMLQRKRMFASLILIVLSIGFWSLYNQSFTSLMLFADRNMNHSILGIPLDAEATQFFNSFFIIALSPILSRLWIRMDHSGLNPSVQKKFALGILFMSLGYLILAFGARFFGENGVTSAWWLVSSYLLQTIGELLLSPIGLAMITVLCPKRLVGMMMGVWFFAQAASFSIGGFLANIAAVPEKVSAAQSLPIYIHAFTIYGLISIAIAALSFALLPFINRLVKDQ